MSARERTINLLTFQLANFVSLFEMLGWGANWAMMAVFILSLVFMIALEIYVAVESIEYHWRHGARCSGCRRLYYE